MIDAPPHSLMFSLVMPCIRPEPAGKKLGVAAHDSGSQPYGNPLFRYLAQGCDGTVGGRHEMQPCDILNIGQRGDILYRRLVRVQTVHGSLHVGQHGRADLTRSLGHPQHVGVGPAGKQETSSSGYMSLNTFA